MTTKTKMISAFPSLSKFLSAWSIYCSIRSTFKPEHASGLYSWQERLVHHARTHKDWSEVLEYIIKYFNRYQKAPPEAWFHTDPELITECFISSQKLPPMPYRSSKKSDNPHNPFHSDICQNWNNSKCVVKERTGRECSRRHVCNNCHREDHRAPNCPPGYTKHASTKTPAG